MVCVGFNLPAIVVSLSMFQPGSVTAVMQPVPARATSVSSTGTIDAAGAFSYTPPGEPEHVIDRVSLSQTSGYPRPFSGMVGLQQMRADLINHHSQPSDHLAYYWSSGRGTPGAYSASPYAAQFNITTPSWTWHHPAGLWSTVPIGTAIDDQRNIFLTAADGIRKFTPDGQLSWTYLRRESGPYAFEVISKAATLMDGAAYCITSAGRAFAVSMDTGTELWSTNVSGSADANNGHVVAYDGVVITAAEVSHHINRTTPSCCGPMNHKVVGLSGRDGSILWEYRPEIPIWNFGASFVGDGTFIFQSLDGTVHRNRVSDGTLVWKAGGIPESWTDGQANLGSNGIVYGVANYGVSGPFGCLSAYRISDGTMLWRRDLPKSPNSIPAIGRLVGHRELAVVMPIGANDQAGQQIDVYAFDANNGTLLWVFEGPTQTNNAGVGDQPLHMVSRMMNRVNLMTMPNSWGCAAIDGSGTVHVGGTTGHFFSLRDQNGDGNVTGSLEVSTLDTHADFVGSSGPALAPGLMAVGTANSLLVWQY